MNRVGGPVLGPRLPVPAPDPTDLLAAVLLGRDDDRRRLPPPPPDGVRGALERAVLPALRRPPCHVSFSGGRDSSAVLALAVEVARRHGLSDPVPVSMRFPRVPESDERRWQELMIRHLRLDEHLALDLDEEVDTLGPTAMTVVRQHGVRWPPNAHMHMVVFETCRGGSLLTGVGGDETLGTSGGRRTLVARRRLRPRRSDVRLFAEAALPAAARAVIWRRSGDPVGDMPWLTATGARRLARALARDEVAWPDRWDATLRHWYRSRAYAAADGMLPLLGARCDVMVVNPLLHPEVLSGMAQAAGPVGWRGRHNAMQRLFGDLLPGEVIARPDKAEFTGALTTEVTRAFAREWDGTGVDTVAVDPERLREQWLSDTPDFRTGMLLQTAALACGR